MSEPLFNIVFYGIIQTGKDKITVQQNMARLFKTEPAKVQPFFAGGRKLIKSKVSEEMAEKYRGALENIGLVIKIEEAEQPQNAAPDEPASSDSGSDSISIAEPGVILVENPVPVTPQEIGDISAISMAEVGADVIENRVAVAAQEIDDISDISMAEVGADVLENPAEAPPQEIGDISELSMAEVGADVVEHPREKEKAPIPDISELSLE
ncbi:MAG: hypothetical protein PF589_09200 [Gammaproteobacteria bacterium]|jgi:hypothetical protein|nr:hypothetical protein [Gammaproteobacteria bacterium]